MHPLLHDITAMLRDSISIMVRHVYWEVNYVIDWLQPMLQSIQVSSYRLICRRLLNILEIFAF